MILINFWSSAPYALSTEVMLNNLETDTLYYYQVGDQVDGWSNVSYFRTEKTQAYVIFLGLEHTQEHIALTLPRSPTPSSPLNILVTADQGATGNSSNAVNAMLQLDQTYQFSMLLFSGDISYANLNSPLWDTWGRMVAPLASRIPMMFSVGNHELFDYFEAFQHRFRMPSAC